ncbi:hypothetical protein PSE10B_51410 [Pseudomonas amygdali pv. eriobotryae]|nr:hypothetical protein PSE10B_51410 [Pseudomonas amygdali pv. eriobotryae]
MQVFRAIRSHINRPSQTQGPIMRHTTDLHHICSAKYIRRISPNISMLIILCSAAQQSEQKQLNTWISFQSAEKSLLG